MYDTVVVGWNGAPGAEEALQWAIGRRIGARYDLLLVVDPRTGSPGGGFPTSPQSQARAQLRAKVGDVGGADAAIRVAGEVAVGDAMTELKRRTGPSALLVLGADPGPVPPYRLQWSNAGRLAVGAHGPVVVVPHGAATRTGPVLVGVEGTAACRSAALRAAELAESSGTGLEILHAWPAEDEPEEPTTAWRSSSAHRDAPDGADDAVVAEAGEAAHASMLQEVVDEVRRAHPGLRIASRLVRTSPVRALVEASEHASVVALGRHRRWSSPPALLGSVAHAVLLASRAPVLVVGRRDLPVTGGPHRSRRESALLVG